MRIARWLLLVLLVFGLAGCGNSPEEVEIKNQETTAQTAEGEGTFLLVYAHYNYAHRQECAYSEFLYDESLELLEENYYTESGKLEQRTVYSYEDGIRTASKWNYDAYGNASFDWTCYYNEDGRETRIVMPGCGTEYFYDEKGNCIFFLWYGMGDDGHYHISDYSHNDFDDNGNWIERRDYKTDSERSAQLRERTVNTYDSKGNITSKKIYYGSEASPWRVYEYDYNDKGYQILEKAYKIEDGVQVPYMYKEFEYDEFGNLIRESSYYGDEGNSTLEYEYKYTYELVE